MAVRFIGGPLDDKEEAMETVGARIEHPFTGSDGQMRTAVYIPHSVKNDQGRHDSSLIAAIYTGTW